MAFVSIVVTKLDCFCYFFNYSHIQSVFSRCLTVQLQLLCAKAHTFELQYAYTFTFCTITPTNISPPASPLPPLLYRPRFITSSCAVPEIGCKQTCLVSNSNEKYSQIKRSLLFQVANDIINIEAVRFNLKTPFDRNVVTQFEHQVRIF